VWWSAFFAIVVATLMTRVVLDGRDELNAATIEGERGHPRREIVHLGRAARWRAPLFTHDERALSRLESIGAAAVEAGDWALALDAYRELRRALWATRAWGSVSDPAALMRADAVIAEGMAHGGYDAGRAAEELARDPTPHGRGTGLAALAFVAWLAAMVGFIRKGLDRQGQLVPRPAIRWGVAALVLLAAWMVLMRHPQWLG
jgi:hypothetical protein